MNKRLVNAFRHQYYISMLMRLGLKPIQSLCEWLGQQIKMKVWVNGISVIYDGLTIKFPRNVGTSYCTNVYWNDIDGFEPYTWTTIRHFLSQSTLFIDIGSNIVFYSVLAKKVNPAISIQSFEPIPSIFAKNIAFHEANGLPVEDVMNVAIGDEDGQAEIYLPTMDDGMEEETTATLRKDSWQRRKAGRTLVVSTKRLDSLALDYHTRVLIKIDVEDFEANVLKGAAELLMSVRPVIVCEILPRTHGNQETADLLIRSEYVFFGISESGLIRFRKEDFHGNRSFNDFLLLPASMAPPHNFISYENLSQIAW